MNEDTRTTHELEPTSQSDSPSASNGDLTTTLRANTDRVLQFLSTASNETLGACIVGLGASTYLVLGRIGLVLIGAVGGVVFHAAWEGSSSSDHEAGEEGQRRRDVSLDVARRVLDWRQKRAAREEQDSNASKVLDIKQGFARFGTEVAAALESLTDAVIRDYVRWWYSPILPSEERFPATSRNTFETYLLSLATNISRKRPADTFIEFVTNSSSIVIVFLNELSTAAYASPSSTMHQAIETYLEAKPSSNLANIIDQDQQDRKLLAIADDILDTHLDRRVYSCPPAHVFLSEILAKLVFGMTLDRCSKAEWINEWIVYLLEEAEPELLSAIGAGVEVSGAKEAAKDGGSSARGLNDTVTNDRAAEHKRTRSRAEDAMQEAMEEAQRLTRMIAAEDEKRQAGQAEQGTVNLAISDDASDSTNTRGIQTPASSQDELSSATASDTQAPTGPASDEADGDGSGPSSAFTDFDQLGADPVPTALRETNNEGDVHPQAIAALTLHKARITIFDDSNPIDRKAMKSKPVVEYMIQIEPASSAFSGWMIPRTLPDIETLHEVMKRIAKVTGAITFAEAHEQLPSWKGRTKAQHTQELERYLNDAMQFEPLAETEGMKRFLDKDRGMVKSPKSKGGFWAGPTAIENMGKGVFDVISKAPKNVAGGGKAMIGGVTSVFGTMGPQSSRSATSPAPSSRRGPSFSGPDRTLSMHAPNASTSTLASQPKQSVDQDRDMATSSTPPEARSRPSSVFSRSQSGLNLEAEPLSSASATDATSPRPETPPTPQMNLPPPPSDMPDDYSSAKRNVDNTTSSAPLTHSNITATTSTAPSKPSPAPATRKSHAPISEKETQVTIELLFAVITELYTLSSAWTLRRTLLNAARTYLLRPGNPQLDSIRTLLQESVLDANASASGIAAHIYKIRENALPTEEELKRWPAEKSDDEKERLRVKARKLLVAKGMPAALTGVMGQAASGEALGKIFDALQVESVARGLMFGLLIQGVRALTQ